MFEDKGIDAKAYTRRHMQYGSSGVRAVTA